MEGDGKVYKEDKHVSLWQEELFFLRFQCFISHFEDTLLYII